MSSRPDVIALKFVSAESVGTAQRRVRPRRKRRRGWRTRFPGKESQRNCVKAQGSTHRAKALWHDPCPLTDGGGCGSCCLEPAHLGTVHGDLRGLALFSLSRSCIVCTTTSFRW